VSFSSCLGWWGIHDGADADEDAVEHDSTSGDHLKCLATPGYEARTAPGPLLEEWRSLLFPAQDEDALWDNMVVAVERRLAALKKQVSVE
jgi:hypothetical protein